MAQLRLHFSLKTTTTKTTTSTSQIITRQAKKEHESTLSMGKDVSKVNKSVCE